jgi:DNA-binding transcriptional LysR family regulator
MNASNIDLNLLVALRALLDERNVTRAAKRLGITQPAMSNCLKRLRATFDDPLLVVSGRRLLLTPRAEQIYPRLVEVLDVIDAGLLNSPEFDPSVHKAELNLSVHDYEALILLPELNTRVLKPFPLSEITLQSPIEIDSRTALESGISLFATGPQLPETKGLKRVRLWEDRFVCLDAGKRRKKDMSISEYSDRDHIYIAPHGGKSRLVEEHLSELNLKRNVRLNTASFLLIPDLVRETNYLATVPLMIARKFASVSDDLHIRNCPIPLDSFSIFLFWHERTDRLPLSVWFRNLLTSAFRRRDQS